jgi:hypothetical protein
MPDHEARGRAVYDHTNDDPRSSARRRRPAADWGVGEEIFDRLPGRRFARGDHPRGGTDDGRRTIVIGEPTAEPPATDDHESDEFASRDEALRARAEHEALWGGDEPFAAGERGDEAFAAGERGGGESFAAGEGGDEVFVGGDDGRPASYVRGGQPGRRTVKIGGRPGERPLPLDRPPRRRPPKTVGERVGARPDRVAMWAFALGLVLILIAVATAQAGV